jgi:hypothetical protein
MVKAAFALAVLVLMAGCEAPRQATSGQAIPWVPLAPNLTPPSPSTGPAQIPANTPPCQANEVQDAVIGSNGATGHILTSFGFAGTGPGDCYLDGTPSVGLGDSGGHSIPFTQKGPFMPPLQPGRTLVEPGPAPAPHTALKTGQASLTIDWISQPEACTPPQPVVPAEALIAIPGGGVLVVAIPTEPAAYLCDGLGVGPFEGPYAPVQEPTPPQPAISMHVPDGVRAGHDLDYQVTLSNDMNQSIDFTTLCPTYEEEMFADLVNGSPPLGAKHIYSLNCGPVGLLKPRAAVTFQMVFKVPADAAPGKYTLVFMLGYWNAMTSSAKAPVMISQ